MGPFPHNAPPAIISAQNPVGTDGFEFVEFADPQPDQLEKLFVRMGYSPVAKRRTKNITVYRQGDINFILNAQSGSFATRFVSAHGPCAASMAWRVVNVKHAFGHAVKLGAEPYFGSDKTLDVPAIMRFRCCISLTATEPAIHPTPRNSNGPLSLIRGRKGLLDVECRHGDAAGLLLSLRAA